MGTQQNTDIDYDWLPKETTTDFGMLWFVSLSHALSMISLLSTYSETDISEGKPTCCYTCNGQKMFVTAGSSL